MRARRATACAIAAAAATLLGACTSSAPVVPPRTAPEPAPSGTGFFVGAGPDGIGASLDLLGDDPVTRVLAAALRARDGRAGSVSSIGVVSIVNDGDAAISVPRFVAQIEGGGAVALRRATEVLRPGAGPAARAALRRVRTLPGVIPGGGAATAYVVLEGVVAPAVVAVRMVVGRGRSITLAAHRR